jgi:hypothetical protein
MGDDNVLNKPTSRREVMKAALVVSAYAAPAILSVAVPGTASAQVSGGPTGTLSGIISNASNGLPIAGATVQVVGGGSAVTNASGAYTIAGVSAGSRTVQTSAPGFTTRTDPVSVAASVTTTFSTALVPVGAGGNITIVLTWGALPTDLDSHLVGPALPSGRFHMAYFSPNPVPYVSLDVDDTTSFGPETTTITTSGGNFVPGTYNYYVHNFSGSPDFSVSQGTVTVFQSGAQLAQYLVGGAAGLPASQFWNVFSFVLTATPSGQIAITTVQQFTNTAPTGGAIVPAGAILKKG